MNRGVWWATVHMAAKNLIGLKRLSMNMLHFHIIVVFPILFPMKSFFLLPARKKKKVLLLKFWSEVTFRIQTSQFDFSHLR